MIESDLQRLQRLKGEGYRIVEINISFNNKENPPEVAELTLKKGLGEIVISSSEPELFSYVIHLHSIPHKEDDGSDFVYVEDTNRYFDIQKEIVDLFSGQIKEFIISQHRLENFQKGFKKIVSFEKNWILSEKNIGMLTTKLCQIFYDAGILLLRGKDYEFRLISKERTSLSDISAILSESQKANLAICFSAFVIGPKVFSKRKEHSDVIVGLLVYDLKYRRTLSLNMNSLGQFKRKNLNVGSKGLWECVFDLFQRIENDHLFTSYLPLPVNLRDYTPLPWFCFAFISGIKERIVVNGVNFDLPLFLAFGAPLLLENKPSYDFDAERQRALVMLGFREGGQTFLHQVRFDMSKGEPNLHVDYQIFPENGQCYKSVGHSVVNYKDIWNFSENLAIGFLLAAAYDINFENLVVPANLSGIDEAFRDNPLTVYPLFVRSMAGKPFRQIKEDSTLRDVFSRIARKEKVSDPALVKTLEEMGLVKDAGLTILGDIVNARLLQTSNKKT
ncbi:MAG: hypothetical protein NWE94_09810 [Candidatus Bathyarchaeota archaeon]|nr:hypothetical protein [Candidatus Bathyarchaeota archaeon]